MEFSLVKTTADVWMVIKLSHPELIVFGSFSDPTGTFPDGFHGNGKMMTQYGFGGKDHPVMMAETTWSIPNEAWGGGNISTKRKGEKTEYWLCFGKKD